MPSSFAGVSIIADCKLSTTSAADASTDSGYHLLLVQGYSRTKEEIPTGESISSGRLMVGGHQWYMEYCPNGGDSTCADFISLYLHLIISDEDVEARFSISFVDQVEEQTPVYILATKICRFSGNGKEGACWGYDEFVRRCALERSSHLNGDCFTIRCDIAVCKDTNTKDADADGTMSDPCQHFNNILLDEVGADVTFEVSGETFAAHRCVLATRSAVFKAQLFGPMKEGTTPSVIQIKDMEAKVFRDLLSFIYTGSFLDMEKDKEHVAKQGQEEEVAVLVMWLQDLSVVADRYDLQRLKLLCEEHLSEEIGVTSVASTLALAEQHYCHGLKEACLKFIQVQSSECMEIVMATDGWDHIKMTYPSLMNEITAKLASKT